MPTPEKLQQGSNNNLPQIQKPLFSEYVDAVKAAFGRIWNNKWLWFWGIFLPMGAGLGGNMNFGNNQSGGNQQPNENAGELLSTLKNFVQDYFTWILLAAIMIVVLNVLLWLLSAIARSGVIQAIHQMQQPTKALTFGFKDIWHKGKKDMLKIIKIDIMIFLAIFLLVLIMLLPISGLVISKNYFGAVMIGLLAILVLIPASILAGYLKQTGAIIAVLSGEGAKRSIEKGYNFVSKNIIESLKLLLTNFVLGVIHSFVIMGAIIVLAIAGSIVGVFLIVVFGGFENIISNIRDNVTMMIVAGVFLAILVLIFIFEVLVVKGFFSLWHQDVWVWWTKRLGGIVNMEDARPEKEKEKLLKRETAPGVNISSRK